MYNVYCILHNVQCMTILRAQTINEQLKNHATQREFIRRNQIENKIIYTRSYVIGRKKNNNVTTIHRAQKKHEKLNKSCKTDGIHKAQSFLNARAQKRSVRQGKVIHGFTLTFRNLNLYCIMYNVYCILYNV